MYQLISKEWGLDGEKHLRLCHYVADSKSDALPESAPVGSDCLFQDGSRSVRFPGGWIYLGTGGAQGVVCPVTVSGQGECVLAGCSGEKPIALELDGVTTFECDPTPEAPCDPTFLDGVQITCGESEAVLGGVVLRRVGLVADTLLLDGRVIRRIGKYVLTGNESFTKMNEQYFAHCYSFTLPQGVAGNQTSVCSHFKNVINAFSIANGKAGYYCDHGSQKTRYFDSNLASVSAFTSWLKEEYDRGTPVTLWYVMENEVVEESSAAVASKLGALRLSEGDTRFSASDESGKRPLYRVTYRKTVARELADLRAKTEELEAALAALA